MLADSSLQPYKAVIAYDGTDFLGFQIQAQGRTVQGSLEATLQKIAKSPVRVTGAGRTDTGVHAIGQVAAFKLIWNHSALDLQQALNANLPADIVVKDLSPAQPNFHPRFSAISRQYRYTILNQPVRDVLKQRYTMHVPKPIDIRPMQQASLHLIGTHDFASFGRPPQGSNTVRTVTQAEWLANGGELSFTITANAFLYRMVRTIVGTLLRAGLGEITPAEIKTILQAKDRAKAAAPALPNGLCLMNVTY